VALRKTWGNHLPLELGQVGRIGGHGRRRMRRARKREMVRLEMHAVPENRGAFERVGSDAGQ